ncbi:MAG: alpha/beta fold hydrolase, partial [Caulobacterales bacterium]|nr:alpha/beta fold hydrolase [Caulobacterales bacterium]
MYRGAARRTLYPDIQPSRSGRLAVGGGHEIYFELCGREDGLPAAVLHGGPGGGCSPAMRRFFDPGRWRVILFDQRGCGRSRPLSRLTENPTWRLVEDMERLRAHLGVEQWTLFGGSWGSTLAIAYASRHRERVAGLVLRGVFLLTPGELDWFYGGQCGALLPEAWERFLAHLPEADRAAPIAGYHRLLTGEDRRARARAA